LGKEYNETEANADKEGDNTMGERASEAEIAVHWQEEEYR
jgi:hypothetical protein